MTEWMAVVFRSSLTYLKKVLRDAVDSITAPDVPAAKAQVEAAIQRQKRLPGTLRRWLCQDVRRADATTVAALKERLYAEIERL